MSSHIVIHHLRGSKLNRIEHFPLSGLSELTIGREPGMLIGYDPVHDAVVSRRHAVIKIEGRDPPICKISDAGSANGTFLNGQRLAGESELRPGDTVELGQGGPKFTFDFDPPLAQPVGDAQTLRRGASMATQMNGRTNEVVAPAPTRSPPIGKDRSMKIAALIFAVLGTLSALSLAAYTYAVASLFVAMSGGGYGAVWQFLSVVIPIACIVGTGILWAAPGFGGATLLACAVVILLIAGFNFLSMTTILLLGAGGGFAVVSAAASADPAGYRPEGR